MNAPERIEAAIDAAEKKARAVLAVADCAGLVSFDQLARDTARQVLRDAGVSRRQVLAYRAKHGDRYSMADHSVLDDILDRYGVTP